MERRAFPRRSVSINGEASGKEGIFPCLIRTLNEKGLGFICDQQFQVGEEITMAWVMGPREPSLHVHCIVRNTVETQVGVEFLNLSLGARLRISHFLMTTATSPVSSPLPPPAGAGT